MNGNTLPGWSALFWFFAIIALIPLALWLLRRSPLGAGIAGTVRGATVGLPRQVAVLPLSAHHKLVTVEVGHGAARQWLVLGVSPQGLQTLHAMAPGSAEAAGETNTGAAAPQAAKQAAQQATFAQLYRRLRSGQMGATDHDSNNRSAPGKDATGKGAQDTR